MPGSNVKTCGLLAILALGGTALHAQSNILRSVETGGELTVEAEDFSSQTSTSKRSWYRFDAKNKPDVKPDPDGPHVSGAGGGAYLEALPDTRTSHGDTLKQGENFFPDPGKAGVLSYPVYITTPGRYYVWVRTYSTNTEDNGLHVGLNGKWPSTGQRMQWASGKNSWYWDSRQRTDANHTGELGKIWLDIEEAGEHTIQFSMREDGFEFDRFILTLEKGMKRPSDVGPEAAPAVSASSHDGDSHPARVLDGKSGSGWKAKNGSWLQLRVPEGKDVENLTIDFPGGATQTYALTIETSADEEMKSGVTRILDDATVRAANGSLTFKMDRADRFIRLSFGSDTGSIEVAELRINTDGSVWTPEEPEQPEEPQEPEEPISDLEPEFFGDLYKFGESGWYGSDWFGSIYFDVLSYIYHEHLGWLWIQGEDADSGFWFYSFDRHDWGYSNSNDYPWFWSTKENQWTY